MKTKMKLTIVAALIAAVAAPVFTATDSYAKSKGAKASKASPAYAYTGSSAQQQWFDRAAAPLNQQ